jgi:hypothetical protein
MTCTEIPSLPYRMRDRWPLASAVVVAAELACSRLQTTVRPCIAYSTSPVLNL